MAVRYLSVLPFCIALAHANEFTGKVVSDADGDTLMVLLNREQVRVRLANIDAPERKQPFGTRSRKSLNDLCHGKPAAVRDEGQDRYGRTIGTVNYAGIDANAEQVHRGMAWVYDRYALPDSPLYALQEQARADPSELWADTQPVPPWEWRAYRR
jgi:endonuclease YncB( thermonuclease family)